MAHSRRIVQFPRRSRRWSPVPDLVVPFHEVDELRTPDRLGLGRGVEGRGQRPGYALTLNRPVCSFQVASTAQPIAIATINTIAPAQPSSDGRKTAAPSFCRSPVCAAPSRSIEAPNAKHATATQSFTCPSPARQREPAPQPPASVIPTPNARPPASEPNPAAGNTHSVLSLRPVNFKMAKPSIDPTSASPAARGCPPSPVTTASRQARTRQKRDRWKITPNAAPKSRKTPCVPYPARA